MSAFLYIRCLTKVRDKGGYRILLAMSLAITWAIEIKSEHLSVKCRSSCVALAFGCRLSACRY